MSSSTTTAKLDALQEAARARNIELSIHRVARGEEIAAAIDSAQASGATALNILASPLLYATSAPHYGARHGAAPADDLRMARNGGGRWLCRLRAAPCSTSLRESCLRQIVKLFRGTKVADIPVEQPTKFELVINLKTAKAIGHHGARVSVGARDKVIE